MAEVLVANGIDSEGRNPRNEFRSEQSNCCMTVPERQRKRALTLIELLCVIAIIGILAAMYFGVFSKVFVHVKKVLGN
jgi:prepilin-type N-terminal cleavage/methylation domain-containing protein